MLSTPRMSSDGRGESVHNTSTSSKDNVSPSKSTPGTLVKLLLPSELSQLGAEDRIAVLNMVKEGEATVEEAIAKFKAEVMFRGALRGGKLGVNLNRRGAVKKYRGRLNIAIRFEKSGANHALVVDLEDARDLLPTKNTGDMSPFAKMFLSVEGSKKEIKVNKTSVHDDTRNPIFREGYSWEIRAKMNHSNTRINIQLLDSAGRFRKAKFLGGMSFLLADIKELPGSRLNGWYRLLDERRATEQNRKYVFKMKAQPRPSPSSSSDPQSIKVVKPGVPVNTASKSASEVATSEEASPVVATSKAQERTVSKVTPVLDDTISEAQFSTAMTEYASMGIDDFTYLKVLGQGSFGKVLLAEHNATNAVFAVKVIGKKEVFEDDDIESTMTERRVLELASRCKFLTQIFGSFQTPERLYYVMELVSGGDLMFHIQDQARFEFNRVQFYAAEIYAGLVYLHDNGVIYRDLKLDNVMLSASGHIKIADFGMCKEDIFNGDKTTTFCGTPGYLAPEIIAERPYGKSVDFWSLGIMIYEMLLGESPFDSDDDEELFDMILNAPISYPAELSEASTSFLKGLLQRDENKRLGCGDNGYNNVKSHAFFDGLDWDKLLLGEVEPPFVPNASGDPREAKNFDLEFTSVDPQLSPVDANIVRQFDQSQFLGFSFVNSELLDESRDDAMMSPADRTKSVWYRPKAKRRSVIDWLKSTPVGTFYIRASSSHHNSYALSVNVGTGKPWNGLLSTVKTKSGGAVIRLFPGTQFKSLSHVVDHYLQRPILRTEDDTPIMLCLPTQ
eukprot:m.760612 g.760612  ORF g.760612 m.760612 type:complete len:786 (+) comp23200_c2_seq1:185-2542(+)